MRATVVVFLKPGVLDVQGKAIEGALATLDFKSVTDVRVGRILTFDVDAPDKAVAETQVRAMCDRLLANAVIETYRVEIA